MVHNLESCATSKVGYRAMREQILREEDGDSAFSGSRSDREFHAAQQLHREKRWLQRQAQAKSLRGAASGPANATPNSGSNAQGGSGTRTPQQLLKNKLRNAKNRKLANARKKAAKAEDVRKKAASAKGAPTDP